MFLWKPRGSTSITCYDTHTDSSHVRISSVLEIIFSSFGSNYLKASLLSWFIISFDVLFFWRNTGRLTLFHGKAAELKV